MEEAITFRNRNGRRLFGIVHTPAGEGTPDRQVGINLLNPGIKYRVAPNRLNVILARCLARLGYTVLRFDPEGIGDSEGDLPSGGLVGDIWGMIQQGRFVPDVLDANDFLLKRHDLPRLVLMGNCGGAITALLAAAEDSRVSGLSLADVPVYLWSSSRSFADTAVGGGASVDRLFAGYLKRVLNPGSWYRFLTLKSDYAALGKIVRAKVAGAPANRKSRAGRAHDLERVCRERGLNSRFFRSYQACARRGIPTLFLVAGNDPGRDTFQKFFLEWYLAQQASEEERRLAEVRNIEDANHVYSLTEWQRAMIGHIESWLARTHPRCRT